MKIVLAIPTIKDRGDLWKVTAAKWQKHTCQPIEVVPSWAGDGWGDGLNEVAGNVLKLGESPDVFICGSDDMYPVDDNWLPAVTRYLGLNKSPCPLMLDPRFTVYGGSQEKVPEGTHTLMSNFPVLKGEWLDKVFPLPEGAHYYADNEISDRLREVGVPCVAALDFVIKHDHDPRGRGAGHGSEEARMVHDQKWYLAGRS